MTFGRLKDFLITLLKKERDVPEISGDFDIVTANPGMTGYRHGIKVDQLITPDQYDTQ